MIKWTKIDIGDGEAIWYSDCLEYQITRSINYRYLFMAFFGDCDNTYSESLEGAKKWCEEHKKNHSQTACS